MHHVMFDVDGTLVESFDFDEKCYLEAVYSVLGNQFDSDWSRYSHITDSGILDQHLTEKGLLHNREQIHAEVKSDFVCRIETYLSQIQATQVSGAAEFISYLAKRQDVSVSIATGGWGETANMKLESAGIDITGIPLASANDHFSRVEIMRLALQKARVTSKHKLTYFGDAAWDKTACEHLAFNFVLVGNRIEHNQAIQNFIDIERACKFIGL